MIGTENDFGYAFLELYAERASEVLGVDVNAAYAPSEMEADAWQIWGQLRGDVYPETDGMVREAEIVVMVAYPDNSDEGEDTHIDIDSDNCSYEVSKKTPKPPAPTTREYWRPYTDLLDAIYAEIWSLREGVPTVLIGPDLPMSFIGR